MFIQDSDTPDSPFEKALMLQNMIMAHGTGGTMEDHIYHTIRAEFMGDTITKSLLPKFVRTCRDSDSVWEHLKSVHSGSGAYSVRRQHINEQFVPLLDHLEEGGVIPADADISETLSNYNAEGVQSVWSKALKRRFTDPQGAITLARTLLEEVCKHILEDAGVNVGNNWDLPKLYSETSKILNLAPSQHTEEVFKRILGGCQTVVENLGGLRNKISDAHSLGRHPVKPASRHAALAVNLAGSMAMFLIETWMERHANS